MYKDCLRPPFCLMICIKVESLSKPSHLDTIFNENCALFKNSQDCQTKIKVAINSCQTVMDYCLQLISGKSHKLKNDGKKTTNLVAFIHKMSTNILSAQKSSEFLPKSQKSHQNTGICYSLLTIEFSMSYKQAQIIC